MELQHLRMFITVAKHAHVSKAATELHMAQPAVSRMIHELERSCGGVALIEKIGRNVRLTEAGEALVVHAQSILAEVSAAEATMRARKGLLAGRVSIGTPPSVGVRLLPKNLSAFHQTYPDIELRIHQAGTNQLLQLLELGEIDIAIATLPVPSKNHVIVPMFDEPLVAVVSMQHRYATRHRVMLAELAEEGFLLYPAGYEMHDVIVSACRAAGFVPRVVVDGGDVALLLRLAEANLGIALVPRLAVTGEEDVAVLELTQPTLQRTMAVVYRSDRTLSAASQVMIRTLLE
ncbi:MAG: LysR family transcriptional regulator [Roseiflexaceae bacterium]|jgi:DNA-binding transcriptional LysR family regulator